MNNRIKHHDKKNALSIIDAAEREMKFTLKQPITDESAFNIIRNVYESFRMLGDARLVSKGIVSKDHIEQIQELQNIQVKTERPLNLIDALRKLRHNINYYGYIPTKGEAEDAISIANACFNPLLKEIRKELEREKTREILGGRSKAGSPILYGSPKQKLEQLKGYGGQRIEEMREKLKREIRKEIEKK